MDFELSAWDFSSSIAIIFFGLLFSLFVGRRLQVSRRRTSFIYFWHTFFCLIYFWYTINYGGDAINYYTVASKGVSDFGLGTAFVNFFTSLLVNLVNLSFISCFLFFNIFGAIGLQVFDACLGRINYYKNKRIKNLATLIIFLPSVSFWSSAIGKDAISFMAASLALWSAMNISKRLFLMIFSILVMLLVRPHIASVMAISWVLSFLINSDVSLIKKAIIIPASLILIFMMAPLIIGYVGIDDSADSDAVLNYIESRQAYNMSGAESVDISSMSLPMQLFTYLFRPIIFEARSIFSFAASIDNLILLYLFFIASKSIILMKKFNYKESRVFLWLYSIISWIILASTTANLGIALRQKWMFAPMLIFLLMSLIGSRYDSKANH